MDFLRDYQWDAVARMKNGCILNGGVGSGKSRTGLYYYFKEQGGSIVDGNYIPMKEPRNLFIITTALKRDNGEWDQELSYYAISRDPKLSLYPSLGVVIDSWNNIKKYKDVAGAFFIFDEDRVTGSGAWVKTFLNLARKNQWIILSATPGDTWEHYIPVFVANGFYKNKTEFLNRHVIYSRFTNYPKIEGYVGVKHLEDLRNDILVDMEFERNTTAHHLTVWCEYDTVGYKDVMKHRWNPYEDKPIEQASELCMVLRHVVNADYSRIALVLELLEKHPRCIIFYNFNFERSMLLETLGHYKVDGKPVKVAEWSGHDHQPVPKTKHWVYLVQYTAGCEGWNCITTDTIIFYSQNYSYKVMAQAAGRIDRLTTPYSELYYYHLKSHAPIDLAIDKAVREKKLFNERKFLKW